MGLWPAPEGRKPSPRPPLRCPQGFGSGQALPYAGRGEHSPPFLGESLH